MIDIEGLLSSVSDEDMAKIKSIAQSLMTNEKSNEEPVRQPEQIPNLPVDGEMMKKIIGLMGQINKEDYRTKLIHDLKPMLSDDRKKKADEAVKFLQLMEILPLLRGMF